MYFQKEEATVISHPKFIGNEQTKNWFFQKIEGMMIKMIKKSMSHETIFAVFPFFVFWPLIIKAHKAYKEECNWVAKYNRIQILTIHTDTIAAVSIITTLHQGPKSLHFHLPFPLHFHGFFTQKCNGDF